MIFNVYRVRQGRMTLVGVAEADTALLAVEVARKAGVTFEGGAGLARPVVNVTVSLAQDAAMRVGPMRADAIVGPGGLSGASAGKLLELAAEAIREAGGFLGC